MSARARSRGVALPIVLLLAALMLVTASAWLQTSLVAERSAVAVRERVQAFHAADSALIRCAGLLASAVPSAGFIGQEPAAWRNKASFEGANTVAIMPFASWPYARRAPQCLIERWNTPADSASASYLVTARGFGTAPESEAWLQLRVDIANGVRTQHWRRVVARPF
jgi:Tfp pilus assembly protein PilX